MMEGPTAMARKRRYSPAGSDVRGSPLATAKGNRNAALLP